MNDIQELLAQLREKKWTDAAISDELDVHLVTVQTWRSGKFYPSNAKPVALALRDLLRRKRIPKQKRGSRYSGRMRNVEAPPENDGNSSPDPDQRLTTSVGEIILTADRNAVILRLGERESLIWYQTGQEGWPFQAVMSPQDAIDIGTQLVRHGEKVLNRTE